MGGFIHLKLYMGFKTACLLASVTAVKCNNHARQLQGVSELHNPGTYFNDGNRNSMNGPCLPCTVEQQFPHTRQLCQSVIIKMRQGGALSAALQRQAVVPRGGEQLRR